MCVACQHTVHMQDFPHLSRKQTETAQKCLLQPDTSSVPSAVLPGVVASQTVLPVIGVPISGSVLDGQDALYSIVQMPSGIPVATVAINGAKNAAYLALQIIGVQHKEVQEKLLAERKQMEESAMKANEEVIAKYN